MAYAPERWHDLFVMLGGASAALAGLVFVGLSLHARAVAVDALHRMRARNLTAGILYVLIASGLVLVPGQGLHALGIELLVGGLMLGSLFLELYLKFGERFDRELLARTAFAVVACVVSMGAGVSLIVHAGGGLYLLGVAGIIGLAMNVFGAWSLLIGLARE